MSDLRKALEQALKALDSGNPELQLPAVIKVLIEMAVLAERKACAKILVRGAYRNKNDIGLVLLAYAQRIRERGGRDEETL
jgi:hypothetical protein